MGDEDDVALLIVVMPDSVLAPLIVCARSVITNELFAPVSGNV